MLFILFLKGILIGFLGSTPLGPINILIIQRTVTSGRRAGFFSGVGAALSDSTYVTIAIFSLSIITGFIRQHELFFKISGGIILMMLGIYIFFSDPHPKKDITVKTHRKIPGLILSTFLLSISNPFTLFGYMGLFAGTGILKNTVVAWHPVFLIAGFFIGACSWWFTITGVINHLHGKFNFQSFRVFNRIAGTVIFLLVFSSLVLYLTGSFNI